MLVDETQDSGQKFHVILDGKIVKRSVPKMVAENYIINLDENSQRNARLVPVTEDGKEILLG